MCLDVKWDFPSDNPYGGHVELWECYHKKTQKWYWDDTYLKNLGYKGQVLDIDPKKGLLNFSKKSE